MDMDSVDFENFFNREEFLNKCYKVAKAAGKDIPKVLVHHTAGFMWELGNFNPESDECRESLTKSLAEMYIVLQVTGLAYNLDSHEVGEEIKRQICMFE